MFASLSKACLDSMTIDLLFFAVLIWSVYSEESVAGNCS